MRTNMESTMKRNIWSRCKKKGRKIIDNPSDRPMFLCAKLNNSPSFNRKNRKRRAYVGKVIEIEEKIK